MLENITINSCLNKIFYKILLNEKINLKDLLFIDKTLFHSLEALKKVVCFEELELYFVVNYEKNNTLFAEELAIKGSKMKVSNNNIDLFIDKKIEFLYKRFLPFFNEMRKGFYSIIPEEHVNYLYADEIELVINGQPFTDVNDWKLNTVYQGSFNEDSQVIQWFWEIVMNYSQEELSRLLQFSTGSSRVPIGGFRSLESNRGEISNYTIVSTVYIENKINFIRAHTCFNRIDLPLFPNKLKLEEALKFITKNEIYGFGID